MIVTSDDTGNNENENISNIFRDKLVFDISIFSPVDK